MSSVFGFFNSFTSFSPFWCCRRVLAERPVDTEPFSALVSFALQADTDTRTQSVLKRGRYRNTGWGDTWSERRVEVSATQTKAQEPSGDAVNSTWPHAVRSGTSLAGRRGSLVTGRRPSCLQTAIVSPGSQSHRSCTCRTKFSASFQDTAGCKHDFSNWTAKIFHRWILQCGDLLQSIILHTGAEKIIFSLYFPKQKQDWNQDQRETRSHISFPPIQGWTLTSSAGRRYCISVLRTYELCTRGWREEEDGGEGQRQGQGGDEQVLSRIKPWGWKLLNPNCGKQAERHRHKSWAEYNWLKFNFRQATGKDGPLLWVWAHAVCW